MCEAALDLIVLDAWALSAVERGDRAAISDVIDATVILGARAHHAQAVTSHRAIIARLDPAVRVIDC